MRVIVRIFVIFLIFQTPALYAQEISCRAEQLPMNEVLDDLRQRYDLHFSYPSQIINHLKVNINVEAKPLDDFLYDFLRPFALGYQLIDQKYIVIKPVSEIGLELRAKIESKDEKMPLPYATIRISGTYQGTYADQHGNFSLQIDHPDSTDLEIRFVGYEPIRINARKFYEDGLDNIEMVPQKLLLEGVTIVEYLNESITLDPAQPFKISLLPKETSILPGLAEADALYSIQMLPGIFSSDETASGINIRGSASDQALVYWDRVPVYHTGHYFGLVSSITPSVIDKLDVYRSRIPIQFTGASAGIIDMQSTDLIPEKPAFEVGLNMTHGNVWGKIPLIDQKLALEFASRRSYNDFIETPTFNAYEERLFSGSRLENILSSFEEAFTIFDSESQFRFWDHNLKLLYQPTANQALRFSIFKSRNALDFNTANLGGNVRVGETNDTDNLGYNLSWEADWSEKAHTRISFSGVDYDLSQSFAFDRSFERRSFLESSRVANALDNKELKVNYTQLLGENQRLELGYQFNLLATLTEFNEVNAFERDFREVFAQELETHIGYINYFQQWHEKLFLNIGMKYSKFKELEKEFVDPILNLNYAPNDVWQFKFSYGIYRQLLRTIREVDLNPSNASGNIWVISDDLGIPLLRNNQTALGLVFNHKGWLIDLEAYYKKIDGLIASNYSRGQDNTPLDFSRGSGDIWGLDVMLKKRIKWYRSWLSYTYAVSNNTFDVLEAAPFPSFLDIRHQLQWTHTFSVGQFEFSTAWNFRTGLPATSPVGFTQEMQGEEVFFEIEWGDINAERLPNYHRMDVSIWYKFPKNPNASWKGQLGFALLNVYNRRNLLNQSFYLDAVNDDDLPDIVSEEQFFIGRTPNLSLKLNF